MEEGIKKSGLCTVGLILGVIGVCTCFIPIINNISAILGFLAVIFGLCSIKKANTIKLFLTIIFGVVAVGATLGFQENLSNSINTAVDEFNNSMNDISGDNTEKILKDYLNVEIGNFEVIDDEYFTNTKLNIKVINKASEKKSYSVTIEAVTEDGTRIETDTIYVNDLNAGQSQNFNAFTLVTSDKIEQLKSATFKVVEVSMY